MSRIEIAIALVLLLPVPGAFSGAARAGDAAAPVDRWRAEIAALDAKEAAYAAAIEAKRRAWDAHFDAWAEELRRRLDPGRLAAALARVEEKRRATHAKLERYRRAYTEKCEAQRARLRAAIEAERGRLVLR